MRRADRYQIFNYNSVTPIITKLLVKRKEAFLICRMQNTSWEQKELPHIFKIKKSMGLGTAQCQSIYGKNGK
jgi:hypothetical protein